MKYNPSMCCPDVDIITTSYTSYLHYQEYLKVDYTINTIEISKLKQLTIRT